jgi:glucose/arabinose dehydrogenase
VFRRVVVFVALAVVAAGFVVFLAWAASDGEREPEITRIATENPRGVAVMPDGRLVVVEAGNGIDTEDRTLETGRVSFFEDLNGDGDYDDPGEIQPIFTQIPSYNTLTVFGTGHDEVGGTGDVVLLDDGRMFITVDWVCGRWQHPRHQRCRSQFRT